MRGTLRPGIKLVIASHNEGKVRELGEMFAPFGIATISAASLGLPEPEESGTSFAENAKLKALSAAKGSGMLALADDSGLEVAALKGEPGIHSARWGGAGKDFGQAMARVHRELETTGSEDRRANFICALALAAPNGWSHVVQGRVDGTLVWPPRGTKGFGYDPIFVPDGHSETFGEMDPDRKNDLSHRLRACELLMLATYADNADA